MPFSIDKKKSLLLEYDMLPAGSIKQTLTHRRLKINLASVSAFSRKFVTRLIVHTLATYRRASAVVESVFTILKKKSQMLKKNKRPIGHTAHLRSLALHLNKIEVPSPKDALCQVWLKLTDWFWRRRFLNFVNVFSLFRNYPPWKMVGPLHLN